MKKIYLTFAALALAFVFVATSNAPSAMAGSNNGTRDWYWYKTCSAGGQTLRLSNYDTAGTWQIYHVRMTTSGSIWGYQPTAFYLDSIKHTKYLTDGKKIIGNQKKYNIKAVWTKPFGSVSCSLYG